MKLRVVLVDDHVSIREMLAILLRREAVYEIVGEAATGLQALEVCGSAMPTLVILDLTLPELSGAEVTRRIRSTLPQTQILIYSGTVDRQWLLRGLAARPHGLVQKTDSLGTLREAIRVVAAGGSYFTPFACGMLQELFVDGGTPSLTPREREVLQMVAESCSTKEIAEILDLAPKTVEHHRQRLMDKLKLRDVAALTRYAIRSGLIDLSR
jgi:DNA-binding NarL/FixJ family response regulator